MCLPPLPVPPGYVRPTPAQLDRLIAILREDARVRQDAEET